MKKASAAMLAALLLVNCSTAALAAEQIGSGVHATCDEAYYGITDYYGNLTEGSVVKSYVVNGQTTLTDYGTYDEVINLTDGTEPSTEDGATVFNFAENQVPTHFYFEGKTSAPFKNLPWDISLHYTLNGVPTKAEDLAGKTGVVEIFFDAVPNEAASEYAKNNYTLEATAIFNQDDILSLEAPGAQIQLIGNLRAVLFVVLPGEEQHFSIRVGTENFSFGGMTFMMVPATLAQLEEFAKLSERKDDLEENYHKLTGSLDDLLNAMNSLTGSLNSSAAGLDALNQARDTFSSGKDVLYTDTDALKGNLKELAEALDPVAAQVQALSQTVTASKSTLNSMMDTTVELKTNLKDLERALENLEDGKNDVAHLISAAAHMKSSLNSLKSALQQVSGGGTSVLPEAPTSTRQLVKQVKAVHAAYEETNPLAFMAQMLVLSGKAGSASEAATTVSDLKKAADTAAQWAAYAGSTDSAALLQFAVANGATPEQATAVLTGAGTYKALMDMYSKKSSMSFQSFCEKQLGINAATAKEMNDLWIVYSSGALKDDGATAKDPSTDSNPQTGSNTESAASLRAEVEADSSAAANDSGFGSFVKAGIKHLVSTFAMAQNTATAKIHSKSDRNDAAENEHVTLLSNEVSADSVEKYLENTTSESAAESHDKSSDQLPGQSTDESAGNPDDRPADEPVADPSDQPSEDPSTPPSGEPTVPNEESSTVGGAAIDLITDNLDAAMDSINSLAMQLNASLQSVARPTAAVVGDLASLCGRLDDLIDLLDDAENLSYALRQSSGKLRSIVDDADALRQTLNDYEPTLQETLTTVSNLSVTAATAVRNTATLVDDAEALMHRFGTQLDSGTNQTLSALAEVLRRTASVMATSGSVKSAKDSISTIIEDTWNEYTGDINNLLLMDATAEAQSLTDSRNPAPSSIQVLIRTQEIKVDKEAAEDLKADKSPKTTFFGRIGQMFKDLWAFVTGIFH